VPHEAAHYAPGRADACADRGTRPNPTRPVLPLQHNRPRNKPYHRRLRRAASGLATGSAAAAARTGLAELHDDHAPVRRKLHERRAARMPRAPGRARPGSERQPLEDVLLGVSGMDPVDFQSRGTWSWPPAPAAGFPGPAAGSQSPASPGATLSPVKNGDAMVPASCAGFSQTTDVSKTPWPGPPPALGPPAPSCCGACLSPDSQSLPAPCGRAQTACLIDSLALRCCGLTQRGPAILQTCHKHPDARRTRKAGRALSAKRALQLILTLF